MKKKVYTVATAHLDTIWSWDFETTIKEYVYNTMADNLMLFEKYPSYNFNFEGSYRYELMEEYYPELFEKVKEKIDEGRWNVCGSAYENGDVNVPSPEALFRNFLYGNGYFNKKFGKKSTDIFLPDCFGFDWALPSIAHHAGLNGFSTQKLTWGSAYGVPFDIGKWYGVDGNYIYASIDMNSYANNIKKVRNWDFINNKLDKNEKIDLPLTSVYYGTGDRGGAPHERSAKVIEREIKDNANSDIEIVSARADEVFEVVDNLDESVKAKLPTWNNELLMSTHAVGSYVSRSIGKRWNRKAEELADMAERSASFAYLLGKEYPQKALEKSWKRVISHQFHDDITGTSVQRAYRRCWNDYAISINQFANELEASVGYIADKMDTSWVTGTPIIVYNSLEFDRSGIVEINGKFAENCSLRDKNGVVYPCQKTEKGIIAYVNAVALGCNVYDLCESDEKVESALSVSEKCLENEKITVKINDEGFVYSILDKQSNNEMLKAPIKLALYEYFGSDTWPAWEITPKDALNNPAYPKLVKSTVVENGPCRVAIKLEYKYNDSRFITVVSLSNGADSVEFQNEIMWHERHTIAKQEFPLNVSNEVATFDLGLGAIQRKNRTGKLYEVPAQKWADITDAKNGFGVSIISDSKASWDKFNDNTLRLTVLHTPMKNYRIDSMQSMMDLGLNLYGFSVVAHKENDFSKTNCCAREFHQPLVPFVASKHNGISDKLSMGCIDNKDIVIRAIKKAEDEEKLVIRVNNVSTQQQNAKISLCSAIMSAKEILADESEICNANFDNNVLDIELSKYGIKSFMLDCKKANEEVVSKSIELDGNIKAFSSNKDSKKDLLACGLSIPSELKPESIYVDGVKFEISKDEKAIISDGRKIKTDSKKAHLLCASLNKDKEILFGSQKVTINSMLEKYAGWDLYDYKETAFVKNGKLGYEFTHCHSQNGDEIAKQLFFWVVSVDCDEGVLTLPNDKDILILAISTKLSEETCFVATDLYDKVEKRAFEYKMSKEELKNYKKYRRYSKINDKGRYLSTKNK